MRRFGGACTGETFGVRGATRAVLNSGEKPCSEQPRHRRDERHTVRPPPIQESGGSVLSGASPELLPALLPPRLWRPLPRAPQLWGLASRPPSSHVPPAGAYAAHLTACGRCASLSHGGWTVATLRTALTPDGAKTQGVRRRMGLKRVGAVGGVGCLVWAGARGDEM